MTTATIAERAWNLTLEAAQKLFEHPNTKTPLFDLEEMAFLELLHEIESRVVRESGKSHIFSDDVVIDFWWRGEGNLEDLVPFVAAALRG